jgi:hypothetical protein
MTDAVLGAGNSLFDYALVLLVYGALFVVMRFANRTIPPEFRRTFITLFFGWAVGVFIGNWLLFRLGFMSFLPWLNNFFHTFIWIGLCLGFLYAGARRRPFLEQFALFAIFSFIVKWAERSLLGTWELDNFFGIPGNTAYIIGWSLMDGLYPVLSVAGLRIVSRWVDGLVVPSLLEG